MVDNDPLRLDRQLCFPIHAAARLIVRSYQPHLGPLGLTYPQYLVLLVLWERDGATVGEIARRLHLDTNTATPLLKRMEAQGLVTRTRDAADERRVVVSLTPRGGALREAALPVPEQLLAGLQEDVRGLEELRRLRDRLTELLGYMEAAAPDEQREG